MHIVRFIHNCKIGTKLGVIYIFCVLLPMIATDSAIISAFKQNALEQQQMNMQNTMHRVAFNIQSDINASVAIASNLSTDRAINEFLARDYASNAEYVTQYSRLFQRNRMKYYYNAQRISQIVLYTDNPTLVNGGSFWHVDEEVDKVWYDEYKKSGKTLYLATYYDQNNKYRAAMSFCRTISLILRLNYLGASEGCEGDKFVKIDLRYNSILDEILNEKVNGDIYICNDQYILFSNASNETWNDPFRSVESAALKNIPYQMAFKAASDEWTVYIRPEKIDVGEMLKQSEKMIWSLIIINLLLPTIIIVLISKSFTDRIKLMEKYFGKVKREEFETIDGNVDKDEIGDLIRSYNVMVLKIKELIEVVFKKNAEKQTLELARKETELKALQSQVNPHFMFNTLESIRMRSLIKGENETAEIIGDLSVILRKSLSWSEDFISLKEEMLFAQQYVHIQQYRFGNKLSFSYYIMQECENYLIPKLSLLTFIENACVHGLEGISAAGKILVAISKSETDLIVEISDSGCGIKEQKLSELKKLIGSLDINQLSQSKSTGMLNALIRMNLYCGGNLQFDIDSNVEQGTDIMIQMPLNKIRVKGENNDQCAGC